ncbi:MAG: hypothetical protein JXR97_13825 [Planctomycetes bacterium]|nr:hypothetical protein [Planctomycetota bacterium]
MPAIVYKQLDLPVAWVRGIRINCEHCQQPYTYIVGKEKVFSTTGVPLLSNDHNMTTSALKASIKTIRKDCRKNKQGEGMCPHCRNYQNWMVARSRRSKVIRGIFWGGLLGFIPGLILWLGVFSEKSSLGPISLGAMIVLCAILGVFIALRWGLTYGPQPENFEDAGSMTDNAVLELLRSSEEEELDPILAWHLASGRKLYQKGINLGLGFTDESGTLDLPHELRTDYILDQFEESVNKRK